MTVIPPAISGHVIAALLSRRLLGPFRVALAFVVSQRVHEMFISLYKVRRSGGKEGVMYGTAEMHDLASVFNRKLCFS